jgi:hypothetical protein
MDGRIQQHVDHKDGALLFTSSSIAQDGRALRVTLPDPISRDGVFGLSSCDDQMNVFGCMPDEGRLTEDT